MRTCGCQACKHYCTECCTVNGQVLGGGFRVVQVGERQYVASVPKELDRDSNTVMQAAQACSCSFDPSACNESLNCAPVGSTMLLHHVMGCASHSSLDWTALNSLQDRGFAAEAELAARLSWPDTRITAALQKLLAQGLAMVDDPPMGTRLYWFPALDRQPAPAGALVK